MLTDSISDQVPVFVLTMSLLVFQARSNSGGRRVLGGGYKKAM